MNQLALLIVCFVMGLLLKKIDKFPSNTPQTLNAFIINICLPAMVFRYLPKVHWNASIVYPVLVSWIVFGAGWIFFRVIGKQFSLSHNTIGCLILTAALGNTSFVGFPMIEAFYGREGLPIGMLVDQVGTFLVVSTIGILTAVKYSSGSMSILEVVKRVAFFPSTIAMMILFAMSRFHWDQPEGFNFVVERLSDILTPLALVSVGFQLGFGSLTRYLGSLTLGLTYKLFLAPGLLSLLYVYLLRTHGLTTQVSIFEAAMPPMITGGILAIEHNLEPDLAALMLGIGIPLSFVTLPFWAHLLERIA
ncbi:MAG: AEC family transporter [Deltaproteobacteria bacterium]|nr:MAG: AEC family transporter [Deltaproteobacteria bacterium]